MSEVIQEEERDFSWLGWIAIPLGINAWLLFGALIGWGSFVTDWKGTVILASVMALIAMINIGGFASCDIGPRKMLIVLIFQSAILTMAYAVIYSTASLPGVTDFGHGLHYSILNWTARGYTDVIPSGHLKFITALQALTGYVFLGLLISVLSVLVSLRR